MVDEMNSYFPGITSFNRQSPVNHSNRIEDYINMEMQRVGTLRLSPIKQEAESKMTVSDRVQLLGGSMQMNNEEMDSMKVIQEEDDIDVVEAIEDQATTPRFKFTSNYMEKQSSKKSSNDLQTHSNDGKQSAHGNIRVGTFDDQTVLNKSSA